MDLNVYFNVDDVIGSVITEEYFQCLMADGKIYTTRARMDRGLAHAAMGGDIMRFAEDERTYGGQIVADSLEEAEQIAKKRGWNEEVEGVLHGIIPYEEEIHTIVKDNQLN